MSYPTKQGSLYSLAFILISSIFLYSCSPVKTIRKEDYLYFQRGMDSIRKVEVKETLIHEDDLLSIQVSTASLNQAQAEPFNPPATMANATGTSGYRVNSKGFIEMLVIGPVKAAGLTQEALQKSLTEKISNYVKDPLIIIHFLQFQVNVLGEVRTPGVHRFDVNNVTVLDAIGASGDLTEFGKREDVTIIRQDNGARKVYKIDLRSGSAFQSPAFQLQSNDIVYIGANDQKFRAFKVASTTERTRTIQIIGTFISLATSILIAVKVFQK